MSRRPLILLELESHADRAVAHVRDSEARFITLEVRRERRQAAPRARIERFLSELMLRLP